MTQPSGILRRSVAVLLALLLCASILPANVLALELGQQLREPERIATVFPQGEQPTAIETADGEITVEEDWNEAFPYGTFAFGSYQADVGENGAKTSDGETLPESILIPVYRLGGTTGAVTAKITYSPAITTDARGLDYVYDYAASALDDLLLEFENPNPAAAYQTIGLPKWQREMLPAEVGVRMTDTEEPAEGSMMTMGLTEDVAAESYRWQAKKDGAWQDLKKLSGSDAAKAETETVPLDSELCDKATVEATWELLWDFANNTWSGVDLRCVYFVDGQAFCSTSMMGEVYEPVAAPEPMPEDLDADADPGFSVLEADERYGLYEFDLTFADGETVKYIRVTALDDEFSELPELALFTITGCEGGELSGTCNTLTLMVSDNDKAGPSTLGFITETVTVERSAKAALIPVRRDGDRSYNVTVHYETADGTAKAGVDYARAEGELAFAGSVNEIEIPVELIVNDATEDLSFTVLLTELQGGGDEHRCELTTREITVILTGAFPEPESDGSGRNLATVLSEIDGEDAAGNVTISGEAMLGNGQLLQGAVEMEAPTELEAELVVASDTRSHTVEGENGKGYYMFTRESFDDYDASDYWDDVEVLLGDTFGDAKDTSQNFHLWSAQTTGQTDGETDVNSIFINSNRTDLTYTIQEGNVSTDVPYTVERAKTNFSGLFAYGPDGSFLYEFGDYFQSFALDIEWTQMGRYYESSIWRAHRYLRPKISYRVGSTLKVLDVYVKGEKKSDFHPSERCIRVYTKNNGLQEKKVTNINKDDPALGWTLALNPPCESIAIGMGEPMSFDIEMQYKCAWPDLWLEGEDASSYFPIMGITSYVDIYRFDAERRPFESTKNGIGLTIYTANDDNEPGGDGFTAIKPNSALYEMLTPKVSLFPGHAGVTRRYEICEGGYDNIVNVIDGMLYVGSQLKVKVPNYGGFAVTQDDVFLTNEDGDKVGDIQYGGLDNGYMVFFVTLAWNNMSLEDLEKELSLNVIYNRIQTIEIDVAPSTIVNSTDDPNEKYQETFNSLFVNPPEINYVQDEALGAPIEGPDGSGESEPNEGVTSDVYGGVINTHWYASDFSIKTGQNTPGGVFYMSSGEGTVNLQSVNFHMDHEDVILVNGKAYAGDEDIILREIDFKQNPLTFHYYNKDFLDAISPMLVTVSEIELWYDGNYDGENEETFGINGVWIQDEETGESFTPDPGDEFVGVISGEYPDSKFAPVKDENGVVHQYFLRVKYTMRPRALVAPSGASMDDKAQILPGVISAVTDAEASAALTEEQRSYRWIQGMDMNDKVMYGPTANLPTHVDIPLGGDVGEVLMQMTQEIIPDKEDPTKKTCKTNTTYTWEPEYVGKLLVPFANPTPITNTDNITGSAVELAGETVDCDSAGVYAYSEEGRNNINAYLASFTGRSALAIAVQQQPACVSEGGEMTASDLDPDTVTLPNLRTTPSPDSLNNLGGNGDAGEAGGKGPGKAMEMDEFAPDLGAELPNLEFPLGDYATIVMDGYQVGFSIGIPLFKKEYESYTSNHPYSTTMDGSTIKDSIGNDGVEIRDIESADKKTHTHMETQVDPTDPNKRTKTITIESVDDNGRKTKRTEVHEEICENGGWTGKKKEVNTNAPETPSESEKQPGFLSQGAKDANEQMGTLLQFCGNVASGDFKKLGSFVKGSVMDDDSFKNALNGQSNMRKVSVTFTVQIAIMFEYNPIDDGYYFKTAGISATLGFEVTVQARLPACPVFYVYLKFGAEIKAAVSLTVHRVAVDGLPLSDSDYLQGTPQQMKEGRCRSLVFPLDMREEGNGAMGARGFHIELDGSVYMRVYDNSQLSGKPIATGGLSGDGSQKEVLFEAYNKIVYVQLEARGDTWPDISRVNPVLKAKSQTVFDGVSITPSLSLEVGAGVGVECLKFEIFLKTNIAITMTMGGYYEETDSYEGFYISAFEWNIAVGFNVTILFINYSMDVVAFGVEGKQDGTGGYFTWDITASLANGEKELWSTTTYTTADAKDLEEPTKAYGANIFKDNDSFTFYNADSSKTDITDQAGNNESWTFRSKVSPNKWWGGGLYNGERPLNDDLAVANEKGAYVIFNVANPKVDLYFKGEVDVWDSVSGKTTNYKSSPAQLNFGSSTDTEVRVTAKTENTKLDRVSVPKKSEPNETSAPTRSSTGGSTGLVHSSGPKDITATQGIARPGDTRAISATGTEDFQLSGYNTSGDAKLLAWGMETGYTYQMVSVENETYVVYSQMEQGVPQLRLSKLVMTGDLTSTGTGFVHPLNPNNLTGYLLLDNDAFMDLDFDVGSNGSTLTVTWTTYSEDYNNPNHTYKVKSRSFDLAAGTAGDINVLQSSDRYLSLPAVMSNNSLWAEASGTGESANAKLKAWLLAKKGKGEGEEEDEDDGRFLKESMLIPDENGDYGVVDPSLAGCVFFWASQSRMNDLNGSMTVLKTANGKSAEITGQIENIETTVLNGKTYLIYTTSEVEYYDASLDVPETVIEENFNKETERVIVRRLWIRSLDNNGFGTAKLLQTIMDADGCSDNNLASAKLKDGIYVSSALVKAKADPYFANLGFVNAQIDENGLQTMAIFEMGGNTYLISEADLKAVAANSNASVTLIPVFSETTGTEVSIGADENGNLLAVYTAPVANSQSNAIYAAWWDTHLGTWGTPTILAMRNLQIYEDRITYDMTPEEAEQSYLGYAQTPGGNTGSKDKLTFSNLQVGAHTFVASQGGTATQLIVLTQGSYVPLVEGSFLMGEGRDPYETLIPSKAAEVRFYAIAFGAGEQAIGEGSLGFANTDFTVGSTLIGETSFTNTGTASIRASKDNPATVELRYGNIAAGIDVNENISLILKNSKLVAHWDLIDNIPAGSPIRLTFTGQPLTETITEGNSFFLYVEEHGYFGNDAFTGILTDLMSVEDRPDLSFGSIDMSLSTVENGKAYLNFSANVQNLGSAEAQDVYIQFSYGTGEDDELGNPIYKAIDIRGSSFITDVQKPIASKKPISEADFSIGVYHLMDKYGDTDLDPAHFRLVTGTLCVPVDCFLELENYSGLHLRAELYSNFDSPNYDDGKYSFDHNEYNGGNNGYEKIFKHETCFTMPSHINTALGTTLRLPVTFFSTSKNPEIVVTEITDGTEGWTPRMGLCYYDAEHKAVVAAPNTTAQALLEAGETPTGIIQVKDVATNSIFAVTYQVGSMADGVNIYKDNASFSFYNADGSLANLNATEGEDTDWFFLDLLGSNGWNGGAGNEIPMNYDLSQGAMKGAYFTFETFADTLTFYFMGDITVIAKDGDTEIGTFTSDVSPLLVELNNDTGKLLDIKVIVNKSTMLDRYVPTYKTNTIIEFDPNAPQILWNRSFPQTASLENGASVPMTCYILDEGGVKEVKFNGTTLTETSVPKLIRLDDNCCYFDYVFTENGNITVSASDNLDNCSEYPHYVDWFNDVPSFGAISEAPELTREHLSFVDEMGSPISTTDEVNEVPYLLSSYIPAANEVSSASMFANGAFSVDLVKNGFERWPVNWNGYYMARIDRDDGTWARALITLKNLRLDQPEEQPDLMGDGSPGAPYLIGSRDDWLELRRFVLEGNSTAGMYFRQIADITITEADMILPAARSAEEPEPEAPNSDRPLAGRNPTGKSEYIISGKDYVFVRGWAFDLDDPTTPLTIRVQIGDEVHEITANKTRMDVSEQHPDAGENHGYEETIHTDLTGKQMVTVTAVNLGEGLDMPLGKASVIIGGEDYFMGVYDGGGYTLTFNSENAPDNCAPFQYAQNATFRNLHIDGTLETANMFAAGLCANAIGNIYIENCRSSIALRSTRQGESHHGGFIAEAAEDSSVTINGCTFDGELAGKRTSLGAGFVGYARGSIAITNCLFTPSVLEFKNSDNFVRWAGFGSYALSNSYYLDKAVGMQGAKGYAVLPGENVALSFGSGKSFDVAGLTAYPVGIFNNGVFYAGVDEVVTVIPTYTGDPDEVGPGFLASAGEFTDNRGTYTLVMPEEDVTITMAEHVHEWSDYIWYDWDENNSVVTANVSCVYNPKHVLQEKVHSEFFLTQPSTNLHDGAGYYKATFENPLFEEQIKYVVIPRVSCGGEDDCPGSDFTDMPAFGHYAHIPIDWAVINHITSGTSATTFGTNDNVTRAQFVTFLWVANGKPEAAISTTPFKDVKSDSYYYKAVLWAYEKGITGGTTATTFGPKETCNRAQIVTFLWASVGKPEPTVENPFQDVKSGSYYYKPVLWAYENGVTSGTSATTFSPKKLCTRAQVVTFLYKLYEE